MKHENPHAGPDQAFGYDLLTATVSYLRAISVDTDAERLLLGLPIRTQPIDIETLERSVTRLGYDLTWTQARAALRYRLPCCVQLKTGEFLVVFSKRNETYDILEPLNPTTLGTVDAQLLLSNLSGKAFFLSPNLDTLNIKHSTERRKTHWFWGRLRAQSGPLFSIVVASLFANILAVVVALFSLQVYDRVIPGASEATLWVLASGVALAIFFEALLRISRARIIDHLGKDAEIEITRELFSRVMGMRLAARPASPGAIVHIVREFNSVKEFFTTASVGVVADLPFVLVFLLLIYGIAGPVVWVVVAGAVVIILPGLLFQSRMAQLSREAMGGGSSAARLLTEVSYGLEAVKTSRSQNFFQRQWEEITVLNSEKTTEQRSLAAFLTYLASSAQQLTYVLAVIAGVYMVFSGNFTIGSIIAISILATRTLTPVSQLASVLMRWQNMKVALQSLDEIMNAPQDQEAGRTYIRRNSMHGTFTLRNVSFTHTGSTKPILQIGNLKISPGERIALIGPIGAGKSSLLRLLAGLYTDDMGEVLIDGIDIRQLDPIDLRRNIGYLPQDVRLFRGTLRENLAVGINHYTDATLLESLQFSGLGSYVLKHAEGLDLTISDGGEGLSFGQRQSIGLARMYLLNPAVILLDEPTASFDQTLEKEVIERLDSWISHRTCVIATHRTPILSIVNKVVLLIDERVVKQSDTESVLSEMENRKTAAATRA